MAEEGIQKHIIEASKRMQDVMGGDAPGSNVSGQSKGKTEKNLAQQLKRLAGIDLGLGALLKQSQIFTGYMGNLFAIIGAIIDTVLAPLAPLAFKALAALGKKIPAIAKMAEEWIPRIVERTKKIVVGIDTFLKKWTSLNWAGNVARIIGILIAINLGIKFLRMSGSLAYGITGARGGVGIARGAVGAVSRLTGRGGAAAAASQASRAATPVVAAGGGGIGGFGRRIIGGGGKGVAPVQDAKGVWRVPKGALGGGQFAKAPVAAASRVGMRAIGRGLVTKIPIIGAVASGAFGYAEGRNQGMSVGKSAARGGFSMGGMLGGAAGGAMLGGLVGGPLAPITAILGGLIGGGLGAFGGGFAFDKLFGGKGGGRGDASNLGVGGGVGLSGYSVPTFIAMSAEKMSQGVLKFDMVIDTNAIQMKRLEDATGGVIQSFGEFSAGLLELIGLTGGMDQTDTGEEKDFEGGVSAPEGGWFEDPAVKAARLAAAAEANRPAFGPDSWDDATVALEEKRVVEAEVLRKKGYMDLPDAFEGTGGASTAVGQGYFRNDAAFAKAETDRIIAQDKQESKDKHQETLVQAEASRQAERDRIKQVEAANIAMELKEREDTQKAHQQVLADAHAERVRRLRVTTLLQESSGNLGDPASDKIVAAIEKSGGLNQVTSGSAATFTGDEGGGGGAGYFSSSLYGTVPTVTVTTDQPPATSIGNSWGKYDMYGGEDPWR